MFITFPSVPSYLRKPSRCSYQNTALVSFLSGYYKCQSWRCREEKHKEKLSTNKVPLILVLSPILFLKEVCLGALTISVMQACAGVTPETRAGHETGEGWQKQISNQYHLRHKFSLFPPAGEWHYSLRIVASLSEVELYLGILEHSSKSLFNLRSLWFVFGLFCLGFFFGPASWVGVVDAVKY